METPAHGNQNTDGDLEELRRKVQIGFDQIERGEYTTYDENSLGELFERVKARGRKRLAEQGW